MGDLGSQYANQPPMPGKKVINTPSNQGTLMNKGDHIIGFDFGHFVVLSNHLLGQAPMIPGQSNDLVHWSTGPAPAGI